MTDEDGALKTPAQEEDEDLISIPGFLFEGKPEDNAPFQELISAALSLDGRLRPLSEAFGHNVGAVYKLLSLPLGLVFQGSHDAWFWAQISRALGRDYPRSMGFSAMGIKRSEFKELAAKILEKAMDDVDERAVYVRMALEKASGKEDFVTGSCELLNQGLVLAWSSLEVLVGDVFCAVMNADPRIAERLLSDSAAKKHLADIKVNIELLSEFDFNLSSVMGTVLTRNLNLSSIRKMKVISDALFDSAELRKAFDSEVLYLLSERRHLIVHRRGIADAKYVQAARDGRSVGERLQVGKEELASTLEEVASCGLCLLRAAGQIMTGECAQW